MRTRVTTPEPIAGTIGSSSSSTARRQRRCGAARRPGGVPALPAVALPRRRGHRRTRTQATPGARTTAWTVGLQRGVVPGVGTWVNGPAADDRRVSRGQSRARDGSAFGGDSRGWVASRLDLSSALAGPLGASAVHAAAPTRWSTRSPGSWSTCRWRTSTALRLRRARDDGRPGAVRACPGEGALRRAGRRRVRRGAGRRDRAHRQAGAAAPGGQRRAGADAAGRGWPRRRRALRRHPLRRAAARGPARHATTEKEPSPPAAGPVTVDRRRRPEAAWAPTTGRALLDLGPTAASPRAVWSALPGDRLAALLAHAVARHRAAGAAPWCACPTAPDVARVDAALTDAGLGADHHVVLTADAGPARATATSCGRPAGAAGRGRHPRRGLRAGPRPRAGGGLGRRRRPPRRAARAVPPHPRGAAAARRARGAAALVGGFARTSRPSSCSAPAGPRARCPARRAARPVPRCGVPARPTGPRPAARGGARLPPRCTASATGLDTGPVLVQTPAAGYAASLACERCRTPARCPVCTGPLALTGPTGPPRLPLVRHRRAGLGLPECGHRGCARRCSGAPARPRSSAGLPGTPCAPRAATGCSPRSATSRRSWSPRRAPSRWPRGLRRRGAARHLAAAGRADLRARRRRCAAGWRGALVAPGAARRRGRRPGPPGAAGAGPLGPGRVRRPASSRAPGGAPAAGLPAGDDHRRPGGALDDALTLLAPARRRRGARPGAARGDDDEPGRGAGAARHGPSCPRAGELQRVRSARKLDAVRVQVDPLDL
jgi:primosomal protein N' (replication factor Y)